MNHNHKNYENSARLVSLTFVFLIVTRHKLDAFNENFQLELAHRIIPMQIFYLPANIQSSINRCPLKRIRS